MNGCKNFQKSRPGFEKWTFLKMSKIEKLKKVLEKGAKNSTSYHNAHIFVFLSKKL